eukprot:m.139733 g.139733  ORF g.139733 m.139733 type:complete len:177 (-) comp24082_c0_seq4:134-664(-)
MLVSVFALLVCAIPLAKSRVCVHEISYRKCSRPRSCPSGYSPSHIYRASWFFVSCTLKCRRHDCCIGWAGLLSSGCPTALCKAGCRHGSCAIPNDCICDAGYQGELCDKCIPRSGCDQGTCNQPGECNCKQGYEGLLCDQPICTGSCSGHGLCTAPETCSCTQGYGGPTCNEPVTL